jgi:hypothetical protein
MAIDVERYPADVRPAEYRFGLGELDADFDWNAPAREDDAG